MAQNNPANTNGGGGLKRNWTNEEIFQILEEYKNHSILWNYKSENTNCLKSREQAYAEMTESLKIRMNKPHLTRIMIMNKIASIRSYFMTEWRTQQRTDGAYKPKVFWYDYVLSFLGPQAEYKANLMNREAGIAAVRRCGKVQMFKLSSASTPTTTEIQINSEEENLSLSSIRNRKRKFTKKKIRDPAVNEQFTLFGRAVACNMKNMPPKQAILLMKEMQDVITKHRLAVIEKEQHNTPSTSKTEVPETDTKTQPKYLNYESGSD